MVILQQTTRNGHTPAIEEGKEVENTPSSDVKVGDTVKVKFNVDAWQLVKLFRNG